MSGSGWEFTGSNRSPRPGAGVAMEPLLLGRRDAALVLGLSERRLWSLTKSGEISHVRVGRRTLYDPDDLRAWVESLKKPRKSPSLG